MTLTGEGTTFFLNAHYHSLRHAASFDVFSTVHHSIELFH